MISVYITYKCKEIYYEELAHVIMEADKSKICKCADQVDKAHVVDEV